MGSVIYDVTVSDLIVITDKARKHAQMRRAESLLVHTDDPSGAPVTPMPH